MQQNAPKYDEMERLAADVRSGRKVVLFPPGLMYFLGTLLLAMAAFGVTSASLVTLLTKGLPINVRAITQLVVVLLVVPGLVLPGILVSRGRKQCSSWIRIFIALVALAALAGVLVTLMVSQSGQAVPLVAGLGFAIVAVWLSTRTGFVLFCEFFYVIKRPRQGDS